MSTTERLQVGLDQLLGFLEAQVGTVTASYGQTAAGFGPPWLAAGQ